MNIAAIVAYILAVVCLFLLAVGVGAQSVGTASFQLGWLCLFFLAVAYGCKNWPGKG